MQTSSNSSDGLLAYLFQAKTSFIQGVYLFQAELSFIQGVGWLNIE